MMKRGVYLAALGVVVLGALIVQTGDTGQTTVLPAGLKLGSRTD